MRTRRGIRWSLSAVLLGLCLPLFGVPAGFPLEGFFWLIGVVNVIVHELGHVFFSPLGEILYTIGGSLVQVGVPLAIFIFGLLRWDRVIASFGLFFTGLNLVEVSRYIADARARKLVTLSMGLFRNEPGEGPHDWNFLLTQCGCLDSDVKIADLVWRIGVVALGVSLFCLLVPQDWLPVKVVVKQRNTCFEQESSQRPESENSVTIPALVND